MLVLVKIQVVVLGLLVATVWGKDFHGGVTIDWNAQDVSFGDVHVFPNSIWSMINNAPLAYDIALIGAIAAGILPTLSMARIISKGRR